jgi:hypothetical protein
LTALSQAIFTITDLGQELLVFFARFISQTASHASVRAAFC